MAAMGFGALPPEVNSGLIYTGPGSGPMLAAAASWDNLAAELHAAAAGYNEVIQGLLAEGWLGPTSVKMATAAAPYVTWMQGTAAQAEQTANQARVAAGAYEAAHAATVPPPLVAANRAELATLVATNVLGQNTPLIAENWAQYYEMWAQDAAAMDTYAGTAGTASKLTAFNRAPRTSNPTNHAEQGLATTGSVVKTVLSHLESGTAAGGQHAGLATAGSALKDLGTMVGVASPKDLLSYATMIPQNGSYLFSLANAFVGLAKAAGAGASAAAKSVGSAANALGASTFGLSGLGSLTSAVTGGLGHAGTVGALSVPQAWAAASPLAGSLSSGSTLASSLSSSLGSAGSHMAGAGGLLNGMPMLANAAARSAADNSPMVLPRFDVRPSVIPISPAAG